jgi:tetratricopeptide (TPR) repeat protein
MFRRRLSGLLLGVIAVSCMCAQDSPPGAIAANRSGSSVSAPDRTQIDELNRLIREQQWDSASELADKLLIRSPTHPLLLFWAGYAQSRRRNLVEATRLLRRAEKIDLRLPDLAKLLAGNYYDMGQYLLFEQSVRRAIEQAPHDGELYQMLGYYQENIRMDYDAAVKSLDRALEEQPGNYRARYFLGYAFECKSQDGKAREQFLRSIAQCQTTQGCEFSLPYIGMARLLFGDDPRGALSNARRAVEIDANSFDAQLWAGKIWMKLEDISQAVAALLKACALDPTSAAARYLLYGAYKKAGNDRAAERYLAEFKRLSSLYGTE